MLIIGRFVLEDSQLNVTVTQAISLDLKTIEGQPTVYDLPQCPPFGACTAHRRAYNPLTTHYVTSEVACSYDAGSSRHIGVQKAIESKAILSACGELYKGNNMVQILTSEIEWNHTYSTSKSNMFFENMSNINKKRNQHLISYEDRYQTKKPKVQQTKVIVNENIDHLEEQNPTSENENKTQNGNDNNVNSKSNTLKSAIKKTMKK
ncbi:31133_t:CDS:2 [Gigaspora margarita]|uniref:31133_t:CDS:1 n=1 Tax=Gigaspora margarita TaxID=4874 RepID=A0ABN7UYA6_GIGMA|nr:31133_t:CDS:2 [Gigaspora margarita]